MDAKIPKTTKPGPNGIDARIDTVLNDPLPKGAWLAYYYMNRGRNPRVNSRWVLFEDGRLFATSHSGEDPQADVPFDKPLPSKPTTTLSAKQRDDVAAQLDKYGFYGQPHHQAREGVDDGAYVVLRARKDNGEHIVIYENLEPPLVEFLYTVGQ